MEKRKIAILGSTGSKGVQALQVIEQFPDLFEVDLLAALNNVDLLIKQAKRHQPNHVVIVNDEHYLKIKDALADEYIKVFAGADSLCDLMELNSFDMVLSCIVGIAGLKPVYKAIESKKMIALANKETLVVAGELMMKTATQKEVPILPVDSEHSAIFQSLVGEHFNPIEKLILTASGGPFRGKNTEFLEHVTPKQALKHPNWDMGAKITIDSATLMNKGLEVIEAKWLFNCSLDKIDVIVHPQSIIHSLVQFTDGSIKAQLGLPDMKLPIQYALSYPYRLPNPFPRFSFLDYPEFTFETPDISTFPCLSLAYEASKKGGSAPCVMNAANEVAVAHFLQERIGFNDIPKMIEYAVTKMPFTEPTTVDEYLQVDQETRKFLEYNRFK